MDSQSTQAKSPIPKILIFGILFIILLPIVLIFLLYDGFLRLWFSIIHLVKHKFIIFVYSNSPLWQEDIETRILPVIMPHAMILNWSERRLWKDLSFPVLAMRHWGGNKEFNPMAIIRKGFFNVSVVRLYNPYQKLKHGDESAVRKAETEIIGYVKPFWG